MPGGANKGRQHARTIDRIKIALRLELRNLGMSSTEIAKHVGWSIGAYSLIKKTEVYKILKNQFLTGILSELDDDVAENLEINSRTLRRGVPIALENLLALASGTVGGRPVDLKLMKDASMEILDRDGRFAKVSRIGAPTKEQGGIGTAIDQETADELLKALNTTQKPTIDSPAPNTIM